GAPKGPPWPPPPCAAPDPGSKTLPKTLVPDPVLLPVNTAAPRLLKTVASVRTNNVFDVTPAARPPEPNENIKVPDPERLAEVEPLLPVDAKPAGLLVAKPTRAGPVPNEDTLKSAIEVPEPDPLEA